MDSIMNTCTLHIHYIWADKTADPHENLIISIQYLCISMSAAMKMVSLFERMDISSF